MLVCKAPEQNAGSTELRRKRTVIASNPRLAGFSDGTEDACTNVMLRALAKTSVARAFTVSGADRWFRREDDAAVPFIAGYHRVVEDFVESARGTIPSMLISAATFERHLEWLARRYTLVSLDDIGLHLQQGRRFGRPAAAVTFDDGYADVYHHAFPILRRKGIPAAVFVVTGLTGTSQPQLYDRLFMCLSRKTLVTRVLQRLGLPARAEDPFQLLTLLLTRYPQERLAAIVSELEADHPPTRREIDALAPMTWRMIEEMEREGITIGSHTSSHVLLTSETSEGVRSELAGSKQTLEAHLKKPVHHFAYPDGRCNPAIVDAVRKAGYRFAYTICRWRDSREPLLTIPRKVLWERAASNAFGQFSGSIMNCHAHGFFDSRRSCEHDHGALAA